MTERTLVLLRHAKADRPEGVADFDRPLTARGHADAAAAGSWLFRHRRRPDLVICSPSRRTRQTWHGIAVALADSGGPAPAARYPQEVYEGRPDDLLALLRAADADAGTVLLIGHNPGVTLLSALLDPDAELDSDGLRTCGLAVHRVPGAWSTLEAGSAPLDTVHTARG